MERSEKKLILSPLVATTVDLGRLLRELEALNETFLQLKLRKSGEEPRLPKTSQMLDRTCENNDINLLKEEHRQVLIKFLTEVKDQAPILHMSFSTEPSAKFTEKLIAWLRQEINPNLLISVGLQPNIAAGTIVRTPNRQFDFSLRENFAKKRALLLEALDMPATEYSKPEEQTA